MSSSVETYLTSQSITTTAHWMLEDFPTGIETLTFTGTDIIGQEDLTASPWTWGGGDLTVVANGATTGPFGLGNSYRVTKISTNSSTAINGDNRTVTAQTYRLLIWARGTSTGTAFEAGTLNGSWGGDDSTAEILFGPGEISSQASGRIVVSGLTTTEWTLIEYNTVVQTPSSTFDVLIYPGSVSNTTNGYAIDLALVKCAPLSESPSFNVPQEIVTDSSGNGYNLRYAYQGAWNEFPVTQQTSKLPMAGGGKTFESVGSANRGVVTSRTYPTGAEPALNTCVNIIFSEGTSQAGQTSTLYENFKSTGGATTPRLGIYLTSADKLYIAGGLGSAGDVDTISNGSTIPSRASSSPVMVTINIKSGGGNCDIYFNGVKQPSISSGASTVTGAVAATDKVYIGNHGNTALWGIVPWELIGNVYDVRVFSTTLTDQQVENLYGHMSRTILSNNQSNVPSTRASASTSIAGY